MRITDSREYCRVGGLAAGNCDDEINKALDIVHGMDFINDFGSVLHQIIDKSGRPDFRIFVMGYPSFFNTDVSQTLPRIRPPHPVMMKQD